MRTLVAIIIGLFLAACYYVGADETEDGLTFVHLSESCGLTEVALEETWAIFAHMAAMVGL